MKLYKNNSFDKFRPVNFSSKDEPRPGRPIEAADDHIKTVIDSNRYILSQGLEIKVKSVVHNN